MARIGREVAAKAAETMPPRSFERMDQTDDAKFYGPARLVTHIDDGAIAAVGNLYRHVLPAGGRILDLMSSWVSHLPDVAYSEIVGHGMNAAELDANPRLNRRVVQDLNADPELPFADGAFDAVCCCVSVQYLVRPFEVFAEVARTLVPGGPFVVTFSNRCFPTKAVYIWQHLDGPGHRRLVELYMDRAGFEQIESAAVLAEGTGSDPLHAVIGRAPAY